VPPAHRTRAWSRRRLRVVRKSEFNDQGAGRRQPGCISRVATGENPAYTRFKQYTDGTRIRLSRPHREPKSPACAGLLGVGETGFEPATARPPAGCATRLRHSPWLVKRATGIEPALEAWKASVQPQHFARTPGPWEDTALVRGCGSCTCTATLSSTIGGSGQGPTPLVSAATECDRTPA
jgi:hypothetical protein